MLESIAFPSTASLRRVRTALAGHPQARARAPAHPVPPDPSPRAVLLPAALVQLESFPALAKAPAHPVLKEPIPLAVRLPAPHVLRESFLLALALPIAPHVPPARSAVERPPFALRAPPERRPSLTLPGVIIARWENTLDRLHLRVLTALLELTPTPKGKPRAPTALQAPPPVWQDKLLAWRVTPERSPRLRA